MKYFEFFDNIKFNTTIVGHEIKITAYNGKIKYGYIIISNITSSEEGWSEFDSELPYAVIEKIKINPKFQGQGIGPRILQEGINYVKNTLHLYFIVLKPKGDIPDAKLINWYEKQGFKLKGNLMTLNL